MRMIESLKSLPLAISLAIAGVGWAADDRRNPTVGAEGYLEQLVLPGSELIGQPLTEQRPVVVRVVRAFRHGTDYRYDLQFFGMEPGDYNLAEYLIRKDGSSTEDLPSIPIHIRSLLPPGQIQPSLLENNGWFPHMGGYGWVASVAVVFWLTVLLMLCFWGLPRSAPSIPAGTPMTLADLLKPRLAAAQQSRMTSQQYAELERMLFAFWRHRLGLRSLAPEQALVEIHNHPESGPLMRQLERWMHQPSRDEHLDLGELLAPYERIALDTLEVSG